MEGGGTTPETLSQGSQGPWHGPPPPPHPAVWQENLKKKKNLALRERSIHAASKCKHSQEQGVACHNEFLPSLLCGTNHTQMLSSIKNVMKHTNNYCICAYLICGHHFQSWIQYSTNKADNIYNDKKHHEQCCQVSARFSLKLF